MNINSVQGPDLTGLLEKSFLPEKRKSVPF